ncbi:MAG: 2-isopropylmalate synthase, partial [Betaproteobacteria bacterium]|nr:2-isopropylmalate synthase [Betaproteobacteria bacterium]
RGCAVAAAELGLMAGGERIEGCLFGNGERTGNADLVTLALNLHTQGIASGLDFSDINQIARAFEQCSGLPIHPRHPYAGDLVFTAFSGSHQDAINKGMQAQKTGKDGFWNVPYLPLDPTDVGRNYDSLIRVNSQSGKGGIAYLMENEYGLIMPRRLQMEFSGIVQQEADQTGDEITADKLWRLFSRAYLEPETPLCYKGHSLDSSGQTITLNIEIDGESKTLFGQGNGPIDAAIHALAVVDIAAQVVSFEERSLRESHEGEAQAVAFVEVRMAGQERYGAGLDENIITASIKALINGVGRLASHLNMKAGDSREKSG